MSRRHATKRTGRASLLRTSSRRPRKLTIELLEDRLMLDAAGLPAAIVVGRTLATPATAATSTPAPSYFVGEVQNNQVTITYTVYNEQASTESGVLLTTTLAPGVTLVNSTVSRDGATSQQLPDQNGQSLAWSLQPLQGYDRESVAVTVSLPSSSTLQLDTGAHVYATLNAGAVSNSTPAVALKSGNVSNPALLASTPDANTTDPYIQEEAAKLNYDPTQIFNFLHNDIGYNAYVGSVRGARGTLWSSAGNALDVASLGVALMRASGIPAQYVSGTLSYQQAQTLILSMFPASYQTIGYIPSGTQTAAPANDYTLQSETQNHYWFQFDTGSGMTNADPLMAGATIGQTFTTSTGTFAEVAQSLRATTEISLTAEIYSQVEALFSVGSPFQDTVVLDQKFNDVYLVGRPLSIGNFVSSSGISALAITSLTNNYTPYVQIGDEAYVNPSHDETITGTPYQEVLTNFPLGSQVLTGLFLKVTLAGADGSSQVLDHTILDRIGYAARQGLATPSLSVNPNGPPAVTNFDITTVNVLAGLQNPTVTDGMYRQLTATQALQQSLFNQPQLSSNATPSSEATQLGTALATGTTRLQGAQVLATSDSMTAQVARYDQVTAYFDVPRVIITSSQAQFSGTSGSTTTATITTAIDMVGDQIDAIAYPGQASTIVFDFNIARGFTENGVERSVGASASPSGTSTTSGTILQAATEQGIPLVLLTSADMTQLTSFNLSADAAARITQALQNGKLVLVPAAPVTVAGQPTSAWFEIDGTTGYTTGVMENGGHQAIAEYQAAATLGFNLGLGWAGVQAFLKLTGEKKLLKSTKEPISWLTKAGTGTSAAGKIIPNLKFAPIVNLALLVVSVFGLTVFLIDKLTGLDPPVDPNLDNLDIPQPSAANVANATVASGATTSAGPAQASVSTSGVAVTGSLSASWSSSTQSGFLLSALNVAKATVTGSSGKSLGTGSVSLLAASPTAAAISGTTQYQVSGTGSLSSYGATQSGLGVSGNWQNYTATVSGSLTITLTTSGLTLNGQTLPAGVYTIATSSARLSGSGATSSPDFAGSVAVTASEATVNLGPGSGSLSVGGKSLNPGDETTLDGYTGKVTISAGGSGADSVSLNGNASNILQVAGPSSTLSADQNTPVTFATNVQSSFADNYTLSVNAPPGWTVAIDSRGNVTATPAPGTQTGTYALQIIAQSTTNSNLVAQTIVYVTVKATQPGMNFSVPSDPSFTVPFDGAQLPTAFLATIQNLGPAADTYNLTFSNVPSGFSLLNSATSVTVPAGKTGLVGLYLQPNAGQALPAPGTVLTFNVTATSTTTSTITKTQTVSFTVPAIDAVTITASPTSVNTTPGVAATDTLTFTNVGNVAENNITLAATSTSGLTVTGLAPLSLAVGQSATETVTFTPDAKTPLNSTLQSTVTATYGPTASPQTQTLNMVVDVVVPGATAIANAAVAAQQLNNTGLVGRLQDLSTALTNLVQDPTSAVYKGQALANLTSLVSQLTNDPFLSGFTSGLTTAQTALGSATKAADIQTAIVNLGTALDSLTQVITDDAAHQFTISLSPDRNIVQPGAPEVYDIVMTNNGNAATTYDLSVTGLPAGVTYAFSQPSVTLQPGQSLTAGNNAVTLTLTESGDTLVAANFNVVATAEGATEITQGTPGLITLRDTSILVSGVVTNPTFTSPGGQVDVSAQILGTVNQTTQIKASYTVTDPNGTVLFTSAATPVALGVTSGLLTVDLGNVDTTGFADGVDTVTVTLLDSNSQPIPGGTTTSTLMIGQPVTGTLSTSPATVPTGSDTVTTTLSVTTQSTYPTPLTLQGAVATPAPGTSVALYTSGATTYAYESGTGGIDVINVTDRTNPQLVETFGQSDITNGKFGFNVAKVVNGELIVGTSNSNNGSVFNLLVYSLANPAAPTLVSNTTINYRFLSDLLVNTTGTAAFVPTNGVSYYGGGYIFQNFGDFVALDLSNPTQPALASALFTNQGQPNGGDMNQFGGTLVNDQIAYSAGLTPGGGTIIGNTGNLLVVNLADPKNMSLITQLQIPGTINILNVAVSGDRALVVGSAGTESNVYNPNLTGVANHLTLTVLDITDPSNPKILGSTFVTNEQFPLGEAGAKTDVVSLSNGDFAVSDTDNNGNPALLVVDPTNPDNIIVSAAQVPSGVHGITVSGNLLYASTSSGLSIYQIGQLVSDPVTITVSLPPGTAASISTSSFNIAPSQITTGTTADTLTWNRSFSAGDETFTFSWQSKVSGVQAGQATPVTQGASISYVAQGTSGTLTLPGTSVTGTPIISLITPSATEQPGGTATYDVRLFNPTGASVTYNLSVPDVPLGVSYNAPSVTVPANSAVDIPLTLTSYSATQPATSPFTVTADYVLYSSDSTTQLGEFKGSAVGSLTIAGSPVVTPDTNAEGVVVSLTPTNAVAGQGTSATYLVQLTNVGSVDDQYSLSATGLPQGVYASFNEGYVDVPPGASNSRTVIMTLQTYQGTPTGDFPFTVTATSANHLSVQGTAQGTLAVVSSGVLVSLNPNSTKPGAKLQVTVTNTGSQSDVFKLSLGGPAALVSTLAQTTVSLAAGASQTIPISTTAVHFALPGSLGLTAVATSQANPDVLQGSSANLIVPTITGMTAQFTTASQSVVAPGTTTFVLDVNNTGNAEDQYSATIIGTTGPVAASLVGLDGKPTQTIALFRLPALSTAALSLQATASGGGQGTVSILVKSLTTGQETTVVASINAQGGFDGPRVTLVQRYGIHMDPTTTVLTFDQPLDPARATNVHEYRLLDWNGHVVPIISAVYDPTTYTVTLHPKGRINLHKTYTLTIEGAKPRGLTGSTGLLLDGKDTGKPGSNYVTTITWRNLVKPPNWNPKWSGHAAGTRNTGRSAATVTSSHAPFRRAVTFPGQKLTSRLKAKPAQTVIAKPAHLRRAAVSAPHR